MKAVKLVKLGLALTLCLVIATVMATPATVGQAVSSDEASAITGAQCWTNNGSMTNSCSGGTHSQCTEENGLINRLWLISTSNCANDASPPCPCGNGTFFVTSGSCVGSGS
jgi:hypothetical protein